MSVIVTEISAPIMRSRLHEGLRVYVEAMRYPRGVEHARAPMWAEHILRDGWQAVAAFDSPGGPRHRAATPPPAGGSRAAIVTPERAARPVAVPAAARLVGIAYGYRGTPAYWWDRQVRTGLHDHGTGDVLLDDYFELTEIHVRPSAQGAGIGSRLLERLLRDRTEARVLLSTPEVPREDNNAWRLYRTAGFRDVLRDFRFLGDRRPFAVLGRTLPLDARADDDRPGRAPTVPPSFG